MPSMAKIFYVLSNKLYTEDIEHMWYSYSSYTANSKYFAHESYS